MSGLTSAHGKRPLVDLFLKLTLHSIDLHLVTFRGAGGQRREQSPGIIRKRLASTQNERGDLRRKIVGSSLYRLGPGLGWVIKGDRCGHRLPQVELQVTSHRALITKIQEERKQLEKM